MPAIENLKLEMEICNSFYRIFGFSPLYMKNILGAIALLLLAAATVFFIAPERPDSPEESSDPGNHEEKLHRPSEQFFLQRSYPDPTFDLQAYEAAFQEARMSEAAQKTAISSVSTTPWTLQGPQNLGGRINAVAIDPNDANTMLVGNASGGIFKTTDGGGNWNPIFDDKGYLAIGDITYEPGNSQVIYAGTGDPNISGYPFIGDGIYKSTDGGTTWTHLGLTDTRVISRIVVDPNNVNKIYVGTMGLPMQRNNDRGLYISNDGGQTWSQSLFIADQAGIIDLVIDPSNSNVLYASSWDRIRTNQESTVFGSNAKVWKTTDGGTNWAPLSVGLPNTPLSRVNLAIDAATPSTVYACFVDTTYQVFNIYKTTNSGSSWSPIDISTLSGNALGGFGWYFGNIFVNPFQSNEIYLLGVQLWRTSDNGTTWTQVDPPWFIYDVHADKHDMVFTGPNSFYLATDGGMYGTTDDGLTWSDVENIPNCQFYRVATSPHQPGIYYGGLQDNGTTSGNAATINQWDRVFGGDGFQQLFTATPDEMVTLTQNGGFWYTTDAGYQWFDFTIGIDPDDRRNWDSPIIVSSSNTNTFYAGTYRVYRNTGGLSNHFWTAISPDLTQGIVFGPRYHTLSTIAESPLDPQIIYAGATDGSLHVTPNGGTNWNQISAALPVRYVTAVEASPLATNEALVTISGYKYNDYIPHVYRTTDLGVNWTNVSGDLPQLALNDVLFHPTRDSVWVVASDGGVYVTQNSGQNWRRVGSNMPMVAVYDVEWDQNVTQLVAGTFGRSLMTFPVDSLIEEEVIVGQPEPAFAQLRAYPNPATRYLALSGGPENAEYEVINVQGQTLLRGAHNQKSRIDVASLSEGVYFVKLTSDTGTAVERFIKQ